MEININNPTDRLRVYEKLLETCIIEHQKENEDLVGLCYRLKRLVVFDRRNNGNELLRIIDFPELWAQKPKSGWRVNDHYRWTVTSKTTKRIEALQKAIELTKELI